MFDLFGEPIVEKKTKKKKEVLLQVKAKYQNFEIKNQPVLYYCNDRVVTTNDYTLTVKENKYNIYFKKSDIIFDEFKQEAIDLFTKADFMYSCIESCELFPINGKQKQKVYFIMMYAVAAFDRYKQFESEVYDYLASKQVKISFDYGIAVRHSLKTFCEVKYGKAQEKRGGFE